MDNIIHPFPCPIYQNLIDKESFLLIKEDTNNFIDHNPELFEPIWFCPTLTTQSKPKNQQLNSKVLNEKIKYHVEEYIKVWDFSKPPTCKIQEHWVNIALPNSYQEGHHHGKVLLSGVIYIEVNDKSGDFQLFNPLTTESILMIPSNKFGSFFSISPSPSMILLFPGWMTHRALHNSSNKNRISISFNINANFN
tara:strand:- start:49 stop:630 length:582 start_codon:yes stop_codon:yes gene_type:complete